MGRRSGITANERRLRSELAGALKKEFGNKRGAAAQAANRAGISRQAMSLYVREKATPSTETLRLLLSVLSLELDIEGAIVSSANFPTRKDPKRTDSQRDLFSAISAVSDRQLKVQVLRKGASSMDLKVTISFDNHVA
jgi:transcriptional regulator with XRE-family HTH domain